MNRIGTNIGALSALNALRDVHQQLAASRLRLATGRRIAEASDDPAGYSVANTLSRTARGLAVALDGVQTTENLLNVAEDGLESIYDSLQTIRELVVQGASDTLGAKTVSGPWVPSPVGSIDRTAINNQLTALRAEIDRVASRTTFNGKPLLDGTFGIDPDGTMRPKRFQTGEGAADYISFGITSNYNSSSLGISYVNVLTADRAAQSLASVDAAIANVTVQIQNIGSTTQRLRLIQNHLRIAMTHTTAAKGRIVDADIAQEQAQATRLQIREQLATAQLAHANVSPSSLLSLFGIANQPHTADAGFSAQA